MTANAAYALARIAGLPAFLQGQVIVLPAGSLEVEQSCSGLGYLLAALTLGVFYGWMNHRGWLRRLLVILIAGVTAIIANILRVFIVVYVGYKTDMQHSMINDHYYLGWYLFGGFALVLMMIDGLVSRRSGRDLKTTDSVAQTGLSRNPGNVVTIALTVIAMVLLTAGPLIVKQIDRAAQAASVPALQLPVGTSGWSGPVNSSESWQPVFQGAIEHKRDYQKDGNRVTLYLGFYPQQEQGRELIYYSNQIADANTWRIQNAREHPVAQGAWEVQENVLISAGNQRRLVWYWYRVAGRTTTSRNISKVLQVLGQLTGNTRASVVAVVTETGEDVEVARQRIDDFVSVMSQQLIQLADGRSG
jgi:EpsI family protein